jgi:uncharacterized protein YegJ (DUF2314 family)
MISRLSTRLKTVVLIALTAIAVSGVPAHRAHAETVIDVPNGDAEMAAAVGKARASLAAFWASYESPKPSEGGYSLKVRFPYGNNSHEHIWMAEVKKLDGGRYSARFANAPVHLPGKRLGDQVEFTEADISDWMFMRNGKIVGGETIKPLLKSMPKAEAAALRARMETP